MTELEQLTETSEEARKDINILLHQLSERLPECSMELLKDILDDRHTEMWIVREDKHIIAMGVLTLVVIPEGIKGRIEDVVVHADCRGKGLGQKMMEKLINRARERGVPSLELSSRTERAAAIRLYEKVGFTKWDTNVYRLKL